MSFVKCSVPEVSSAFLTSHFVGEMIFFIEEIKHLKKFVY